MPAAHPESTLVLDPARTSRWVDEDGTVSQLLIDVGAKVPVGTTIAWLAEPGEKPQAPGRTTTAEPLLIEKPAPHRRRPQISPAARKRAAELGVGTKDLKGHGPQGAITRRTSKQPPA
ncbi:E3 binding domain-containing protein [Pseudomonas corrugata]